ncbi:hypothetical protein AOCH_000366 [Aspergillus ochraceoroseus]|uniref:Uncharacterized protein n=2 Tax=Aspergillus ochraceoroseus TaxID=138278 RepID=A0A0F8TZF0_9EURO|nr:hypothetical protein AOCH_000366 [Aspergillus ochraceoroseus]
MPTPVAKGIIIGVAALVAAGIAVYESPQFRRWVNNSRRKLAMALHNLGDEISPGEMDSPLRDISMVEEPGVAAEERRRIAREELQLRRSILEERQKWRSNASIGTFDTLVDEHGNLLDSRDQPETSMANSTAVDLGAAQALQRGKQSGFSASASTLTNEDKPIYEHDRLQLSIPAPQSRAPSVTAGDFTPVSEISNNLSASVISQPSGDEHRPRSASSSSHTEGGFSEVIYAHPESIANGSIQEARSPFSDLEGLSFAQERPATPATPSTADGYSHIAMDASSDGTLSDMEGSVHGIMTPASWSEVGSEVSSDEYNHHGF